MPIETFKKAACVLTGSVWYERNDQTSRRWSIYTPWSNDRCACAVSSHVNIPKTRDFLFTEVSVSMNIDKYIRVRLGDLKPQLAVDNTK